MLLKASLVILCLATVALADSDDAPTRKITTEWNPGCDQPECGPVQNGSYLNVVYVKATGEKDEVHYLYSTFEAFSVLVFRSTLGGKLSIDWKHLVAYEANNITVTGAEILEKSAYIIPYFYEFEDKEGVADMTKNITEWKYFPTRNLTWSKFTPVDGSIGYLEGKTGNSTFKFNFRNKGDASRDTSLPHLLFTPETTTMDLVIDSPATWHLSKFALQFLYLSNAQESVFSSKKTMDDEYTPGTFTIWNIEFNGANGTTEGFFQCKPSFYFSEPKTLENSTLARSYNLKKNINIEQKQEFVSLALALFDQERWDKAVGMNISFGIQGNEKDAFFHSQTNYTTWSFSLGLGQPPVDKMSFIVTLVITVGFGLPAVIIIGGTVFMIIRKVLGSRRSEFEPLN